MGEVADLIVRCETVRQACCATEIAGDIYLSVRTAPDGGNATRLLLESLGGKGSGGGHNHRAGGKLSKFALGLSNEESVENELEQRWLSANGAIRRNPISLAKDNQIETYDSDE